MKFLFLFATQAEGGAPGYLSARGEESAALLCDSICTFCMESLRLDLEGNFATRAASLNRDPLWKSFEKQDVLKDAIQASLALYQPLLLVSGAHMRSLKTLEQISEQMALPICVENNLDKFHGNHKGKSLLGESLENILNILKTQETKPQAILVGTSLGALQEWLRSVLPAEKGEQLSSYLSEVTNADAAPTILMSGFEETEGKQSWIFE